MIPYVLVTGGAQRIGKAIALTFAAEAYGIVLHYDSSKEEAMELSQQIQSQGGECIAIQAHFASGETAGFLKKLDACPGAIVGVVNNAAHFRKDTMATMDAASWDRHHHVNYTLPVRCIQWLLQRASADKASDAAPYFAINILDYVIDVPPQDFTSYVASKTALGAITKQLARTAAPHLRVNGIALSHTERHTHQDEARFQATSHQTLLHSKPKAEEVADACLFLAKNKAITGDILYLDCGKRLLSQPFWRGACS